MKKNKSANDLYSLFIQGNKIEDEYCVLLHKKLVNSFYKQNFNCEYSVDIGVIVCEVNDSAEKVAIIHDLDKDGITMQYEKGEIKESVTLYDKRPTFDSVLTQNPVLAYVGKVKEFLDLMPNGKNINVVQCKSSEHFLLNYEFTAQENTIVYGFAILVTCEDGHIKIDCTVSSRDKACTATSLPETVNIISKTISWFQLKVNSILDGNAIINKALHPD